MVFNKSSLSERDICTKYITPALVKANWSLESQIREGLKLTNGRIIVKGKFHPRTKNTREDYVLFYMPNIPIIINEAKDKNHSIADGMQQALGYAEMLKVPFVLISHGEVFLFHRRLAAKEVVELSLTEVISKSNQEISKLEYEIQLGVAGTEIRRAIAENHQANIISHRDTRRKELQQHKSLTLQAVERINSIYSTPSPGSSICYHEDSEAKL
jgi:type I site-specific restriction endonuclease